MSKRVVITKEILKDRKYLVTALFSDNKLTEVSCENTKKESILGNIYVGKISRIVEKINAAFVEIAPGQRTYLSLADAKAPFFVRQSREGKLTEGDELAVQVIKEAVKTKAPTVSAKLTWQGEFVVLTTENTRLGISKKLPEEIKSRFRDLFYDKTGEDFGLIVRTNAGKHADAVLLEEYNSISKQFSHFKETYKYRNCYSILLKSPGNYMNFLKGMDLDEVEQIVTDEEDIYQEILGFFQGKEPLASKVKLYQDSMLSLSNLYGLRHKIEDALKERVWLNSGAYLVIQPTEALTVIDVNSGKAIKGNAKDYFKRVNLEAAEEIARQLRLRNISGICIVDFINMGSKEDEALLAQTLKEHLKADPVPAAFLDFTKLGLAEITRKKLKKPLWEQVE